MSRKDEMLRALRNASDDEGRKKYQRNKARVKAMPSESEIRKYRVIDRPDFLNIAGKIGSRLD